MKDEFRRLEETNVWNRVVVFLFTVKKQKKHKLHSKDSLLMEVIASQFNLVLPLTFTCSKDDLQVVMCILA